MDKKVYEYRAVISRVIDGDTVDAIVDLGFHMTTKQRFRLANIDTPELKGEEKKEGLKAKEFVKQFEGKKVIIRTYKPDKYGRFLADIFVDYDGVEGTNLNNLLMLKGLAAPY